jgi:shikimate kinase
MKTMQPDTIYLCGFMGVGKTTIGRQLSAEIGYRFADLDHLIEEGEGFRVSEIFNRYGEPYFRELEFRYLLEQSKRKAQILALGGGTLQSQPIVDFIKEHGTLVFLEIPIEVIVQRLRYSRKRPLLLKENGERRSLQELTDFVTELYKKRLHNYRQADVTLQIDPTWSVHQCIDEFKKLLKITDEDR